MFCEGVGGLIFVHIPSCVNHGLHFGEGLDEEGIVLSGNAVLCLALSLYGIPMHDKLMRMKLDWHSRNASGITL